MVQGILAAAPYILQAASMAGGIFGNKRKHIDPEALRQMFGPRAVSKDVLEMTNYILNSPYGRQLLDSASEQGQTVQTEMDRRAAQSGLSPETGGQSATSDFAVGAAAGAQSGFERAVRGNIMQAMTPIAAEGVANRQNLYVNDLMNGGYQTAGARLAEQVGSAAGNTAAMIPMKKPAQTVAAGAEPIAQNVPAVQPAGQTNTFAAAVQPSNAMRSMRARRQGLRSSLSSGAVQRPVYA